MMSTAPDLQPVIDLCRSNGIEYLKLPNGTEIKFHVVALQKTLPVGVKAGDVRVGKDATQDDDLDKQFEAQLSPLDRQVLADARMEQLLNDDPLAFEDLMIRTSMEVERRRQQAEETPPTPAN